jgi:hypothetical protein
MAEVDVLLNNRDFVMAVEVKAQPTIDAPEGFKPKEW